MSKSGKGSRWQRRLWMLVVAGLLTLAAYSERDWLLIEMAKAWAVNDPVPKADAIVVLGGGVDSRPAAAAALYHAGVARIILYMNVKLTPAEKMGITITETEETRRILLSNDVPESAIQNIGTNVASTFDESRAVCNWASRTGAKSVEIVTDVFHTRRARWIFEKELKGTGVRVHLEGQPTLEYGLTNWWQHEEGVIAFQNEVIKYFYYRLAY